MSFVGAHSQFSHFEWQETLHTLRNILITRLQQGKESFVLFVDLVKAFDSADHKVLFSILGRYGVPNSLIEVIDKIYANINLRFTWVKKVINKLHKLCFSRWQLHTCPLFLLNDGCNWLFRSTFQLEDSINSFTEQCYRDPVPAPTSLQHHTFYNIFHNTKDSTIKGRYNYYFSKPHHLHKRSPLVISPKRDITSNLSSL